MRLLTALAFGGCKKLPWISMSTLELESSTWASGASRVSAFIPRLSSDKHKGSCGRVAVLGGSKTYSGAPYYSASAALKVGADLSFVLTSEEACLPIKCYGPELMVEPVLPLVSAFDDASSEEERDSLREGSVQRVVSFFPRIHALLIGPGLGRHLDVMKFTARIIEEAKLVGLPIVIDADGLFLVAENPSLVAGYQNLVLTPNAAEFTRLRDAVFRLMPLGSQKGPTPAVGAELDDTSKKKVQGDMAGDLGAVCRALGNVTILLKGRDDLVCNGEHLLTVSSSLEPGSPRRSGGIGDLLSGAVIVLVNWAVQAKRSASGPADDVPPIMRAAWAASILVRRASAAAFSVHKRSTTAPDILQQIGPVGNDMFPVE